MNHRRSVPVILVSALAIVGTGCAQPGRSAATNTTIPPTTTAAPIGTPQGIVAIGREVVDGEPAMFVLDPTTGGISSVLLGPPAVGEGVGDLFLDPSANMLYFSRIATACSSDIIAVDPSTVDEVVVASGSLPVVSRDGRYLAYALDPVCRRQHDIRVRDLTTGDERVWESELDDASGLAAAVTALSWSPDGASLAVEIAYEDGSEIRLIDATADGGTISAGKKLEPPAGAAWGTPRFLADGSLVVAESCCSAARETFAIVAVDPRGSSAATLIDLPASARLVGVHPTGEAILLVLHPTGGASELWEYTPGLLRFVAADVADAAWLIGHAGPVTN